jgi:hypothetical protein
VPRTTAPGEMEVVGLLLRFLDPLHFSGGYAGVLIGSTFMRWMQICSERKGGGRTSWMVFIYCIFSTALGVLFFKGIIMVYNN